VKSVVGLSRPYSLKE
ncbi:hypothetical protein A2U01_0103792, partial [Trifolium medium]|nr:hypothetical protein [Trifolium medium]